MPAVWKAEKRIPEVNSVNQVEENDRKEVMGR